MGSRYETLSADRATPKIYAPASKARARSDRTARWESSDRYYELYAGEDLFGELILVKVWGGKGSGRGGRRTLAGSPAMLERERRAIIALRRRHGYMEVACI